MTSSRAEKGTQKSAKSTTATGEASKGFTDEERAAMRERAQELKADARPDLRAGKASEETAVLEKIAAMSAPDRAMGERLHAIIKASAPGLSPKLWYGMPAYAKDGNVVCFFQGAQKFKTRYATLGFSDKATLDEGHMWPTGFALKELTAADEARIALLVKKAVSSGPCLGIFVEPRRVSSGGLGTTSVTSPPPRKLPSTPQTGIHRSLHRDSGKPDTRRAVPTSA